MRPFVVVGLVAITTGGFVAAVTGPVGLAHGSWAAAYLVLVAGVAQLGLGAGQALLGQPHATHLGWQLALFNVANVAVLAGTLAGALILTLGGGVLLFVALILFVPTARRTGARHRWYRAVYTMLLAVLAVSIPVGVALSALRRG